MSEKSETQLSTEESLCKIVMTEGVVIQEWLNNAQFEALSRSMGRGVVVKIGNHILRTSQIIAVSKIKFKKDLKDAKV